MLNKKYFDDSDFYSICGTKLIEPYLYHFFLSANDRSYFKYGRISSRELDIDEIRREIVELCNDVIQIMESDDEVLFCDDELLMVVSKYTTVRNVEFDDYMDYMKFIIENINELVKETGGN